MSLSVYLTIPACATCGREDETIFQRNITHNLTPMWRAAGCMVALYDATGKRAEEIAPVLERALNAMFSDPSKYKGMNPENGWGDYDGAVTFLREYFEACRRHPHAIIRVSA